MLTLTCKLQFPDGASVTGRLQAASPEGEYRVTYEGAVYRLPKPPKASDAAYLEFLFQSLAKQLSGELQIEKEGQYDRWAE
jgi:hypothetical protein